MSHTHNSACGSTTHFNRRTLLQMGMVSGMSWLTPLATTLARQSEQPRFQRPRSVIVLWLAGGASQLETFDPHPNTDIAGGSRAIKTRQPGVLLGEGLTQLADHMDCVSLVRGVTSKEGDHERAVYNVKTGYRPDPTLIHPAMGAVVCNELKEPEGLSVEIPHAAYVSYKFPFPAYIEPEAHRI